MDEADLIHRAVTNIAMATAEDLVAAVSKAAAGPPAAIVRALAGRDPIVAVGRDGDSYVCLLCLDDMDDEWREHAEDVVHHDDCPWVLAQAWAEANP